MRVLLFSLYLLLLQVLLWDRESQRDVLPIVDNGLVSGRDLHCSFRMEVLATAVSTLLYEQTTRRAAAAVCYRVQGLLGSDIKALLFHEGDSALLRRIERIRQGTLATDGIGEIVTHVGEDLVHGRSPVETRIHLTG